MEADAPRLLPLTPEARDGVQADEVLLDRFPFRIGRESRYGMMEGKLVSLERRKVASPPNNDLYIIDREEFLNISREHCQIEQADDGGFVVVDRGSTCGTIVDKTVLGSGQTQCPITDGGILRIGTSTSPFLFRFVSSLQPST